MSRIFRFLIITIVLSTSFLWACLTGGCGTRLKNADIIYSYVQTTGYNQETIAVRQPHTTKDIDVSRFGLSEASKDNSAALIAAFTYCAQNPFSRLIIPKGTYRFNSKSPLVLSDAHDIILEGGESVFIFADIGYPLLINCDAILIQNLTFDWDWDTKKLATLAVVQNVAEDHSYVDFIFPYGNEISPEDQWLTMNQFDPVTLTPGLEGGKEFWQDALTFLKTEQLADNELRVYHNGALHRLQDGEHYLVRHHMYSGNVFNVNQCANISFRQITIYSAAGMGFYLYHGTSHYQISDCKIINRPGTNRFITTTADAIHCSNTNGFGWIENCEISGMGDDCINIHNGISVVQELVSSKACLANNAALFEIGDMVQFRTSDFIDIGFSSRIMKISPVTDTTSRMVFADDLPDEITGGAILSNTKYNADHYVIRGNYFHENRARGLLLRTGWGLVEHNRFFRTQGAAILIQVDVAKDWNEGTGLENIDVVNNVFDQCNVNDWSALIDFSVNIPGGAARYPIFKNLVFKNNQFINFPSRAFHLVSSENLTIVDNIFINDRPRTEESADRETIWIERSRLITISDNKNVKSALIKEPLRVFLLDDASAEGLVIKNNELVSAIEQR